MKVSESPFLAGQAQTSKSQFSALGEPRPSSLAPQAFCPTRGTFELHRAISPYERHGGFGERKHGRFHNEPIGR